MIRRGVRATVFWRDGHRCCKCGSRDHLTIDHVIPKCMGGANNIKNYQTLCAPCNQKKSNRIEQYSPWKRTTSYINHYFRYPVFKKLKPRQRELTGL